MKPCASAQIEFDARAYRTALGCFPTGVAIVTAKPPGGSPIGLTISYFSSVSLDPPLVLWSLRRDSQSRDQIAAAGHFVINVLSREQDALALRFAKPVQDRFDGIETTTNAWGAPRIAGTSASFDCTLADCFEGGDHVIFLGRVQQFHAASGSPLVFCRGRFTTVGGE